MSKVLVAYYSVGGTTAKAGKALAAAEGADLFAIRPDGLSGRKNVPARNHDAQGRQGRQPPRF